LETAEAAGTALPIYIVVAGERNRTAEAELQRDFGVSILVDNGPMVTPPPWASSMHMHSFSRIAALRLTQFEKVIVMDNDMSILANIDDVATAPAPAMVWHTATVLAKKEHCAVTGGMFALAPSLREYQRALYHLYYKVNMQGSLGSQAKNKPVRCYDGSDQEFWRSFYRPMYELPLRYHAHNALRMNASEWARIRVLHNIAGSKGLHGGRHSASAFRSAGQGMPNDLRHIFLRYFE